MKDDTDDEKAVRRGRVDEKIQKHERKLNELETTVSELSEILHSIKSVQSSIEDVDEKYEKRTEELDERLTTVEKAMYIFAGVLIAISLIYGSGKVVEVLLPMI